MAQVLVTVSTPVGYVLATMQSTVDALVSNMAAGKAITAADVAELVSIYNTYVSHYHTVSDLRGVNTYGNLNVYGSGVYVAKQSSTPTGKVAGTTPVGVSSGSEITAADINTIIGFINSMRNHNHTIDDTTS